MKAIDYRLSDAQADALKGAVLLPSEYRAEILKRFAAAHGADALVALFTEFIGLANSVVANNREMIEMIGIIDGHDHPNQVEKYNLPTIFGALNGVALANAVNQEKTCPGCAYRLATPANQCEPTVIDADWCQSDGEPNFMCHEKLDNRGEPTTMCLGHAQVTKSRRRALAESEAS